MTRFRGCFLVYVCFSFFFLSCFNFAASTGDRNLFEIARTAGYGEEKLSSVLVTGTVLCESCLDDGEAQSRSWHIPGASVAVKCKTGREKRRMNWALGITDEYGDFIIDLPSHLHAIPNLDKVCMVRVFHLPKNSSCRRAFLWKPKAIRLSSVGNGIRTYTTGIIRFQPKSKPWKVCLKKATNFEEERSW